MPDRCPLRGYRPCVDDVCAHSDDCPWPPRPPDVSDIEDGSEFDGPIVVTGDR